MRRFLIKIYDFIVFRLPSSAIMLFHHVSNNPNRKKSSCMVDTKKFYDIINSFENYASVEEVYKKPAKRKVAVTFDDGLQDVYDIAYPFLKEKNIPFTVYVLAEFIDKEGYLTKEQLLEMAADPLVTIGSHGLHHGVFTKMSAEEKRNEVFLSKSILEQTIGRGVTNFAYSHGVYDKDALKLVREYDYAMSVAARPVNVITRISRYILPRFNITDASFESTLAMLKKIV